MTTAGILRLILLPAFQLQCAVYESAIDQKWTKADGLPSSSISGITRSADGFLWIATLKGLVRFDGARFDPFTQPLPPRDISYLTSGPDSRIYVGTYGAGFATIQRNQVRTFTRAEVLSGLRISMILPVGKDEAWVGTHNGALYYFKADTLTEVGVGILPGAAIYGLARTSDGVVWIGTGAGLFQLRDKRLTPYHPQKPIPSPSVSDLAVTTNGSVFAATERGLLRIDGDQWRFWTTKDGLPGEFVKVLASAGEDLWIGTNAGLAKLRGNAIERVGATTCPVFSLLPEADGGVWFGCEEAGGLHHLRYPFLRALKMPKPLVDAQIYSFLSDRAGGVWITSSRGLARWQDTNTTLYTMNDGLESNEILSISRAPDQSLWIATNSGFANLNKGRIRSFHSLPKGSSDPIHSILQDRSGTLWVGAHRGLLYRRSGETELKMVPQVTSPVWSLREDSKGNVWAATDDSGLFRISNGSVVQYGRNSGLQTNTAIDTWESANGDIWVATKRGIVRIRDGKCAQMDAANGLPAGPVQTLLDDGKGSFWIRFGDGIFIVNIVDANRVLDQGSGTISGRFIGPEDGFGELLSANLGEKSIFQHPSGVIWCALVNGIGVIDPLALSRETPALLPNILHVVTDAGERDLTKRVVIKSADRNVRFAFSAPTVTGANSLEYRYRLTGLDNQWRKLGAGTPVAYTSLPPGSYGFEVSARRPYGVWSNASAPIDLQVLPHFYQTWWWYFLTAIAFFVTMLVMYRLRLVTVRRKFAVLMAERLDERSRLARELHDTVSRNLTGIQAQLEAAQILLKRDPPALGKYLDNVSRLASEASKEARLSIFSLRSPELSGLGLQQLLQRSADAFSLNTSIQVAVEVRGHIPELDKEVRYEVLRMLEEALANVRLHSGANRAVLSARSDENCLLIEVQDDGEGFEPFSTSNPQRGHFGLVGMRERAQRIHGKLSVQSKPGCGTKVSLHVPLHMNGNWKTSGRIWPITAALKRCVRFGMGKTATRSR